MKKYLILLVGIALGCQPEGVNVELEKIDEGLARFTVDNRTADDIESIEFELVFYDEAGEEISRTSHGFKQTSNSAEIIPFVRAGQSTFFATKVPEGTFNATAYVIEMEVWSE